MNGLLAAWTPYCGAGATPADFAVRWNDDPLLLALFSVVFIAMWRHRCSVASWAALGLAALLFISPLCALSSALFAARTLHHVLLIAGLAPLVAWALPRRASRVGASTATCVVVFWSWHAPDAYAWAMSSDAAYWIMQITLAGTAIWFWMAIRGAGALAAVGALLVSTVQMGLLGALLTVANRAIYAPHAATTFAWGLTPLQDQQIAGLIMWAPAAAVYLAVALGLLARRLSPEPAVP